MFEVSDKPTYQVTNDSSIISRIGRFPDRRFPDNLYK